MLNGAKEQQKNVINIEKYRAGRMRNGPPGGLAHEQVMGDPDPPAARIWLQNGSPKASLQNIKADNASQLLMVALSMCVELAIIAQRTGLVSSAIDISY